MPCYFSIVAAALIVFVYLHVLLLYIPVLLAAVDAIFLLYTAHNLMQLKYSGAITITYILYTVAILNRYYTKSLLY
jgi:hypothetical protein